MMNGHNGFNKHDDTAREHLVDWLRDAHAMEMKAIEILEKQGNRFDEIPEMRNRVRQHVEETKRQAIRLERCINRLDSDHSMMKDLTGKTMGTFTAMANAFASDEIVKNAIADFSFEEFEIGCYESLIEAARFCGESQVEEVCRENLEEEKAMAEWVEQRIPEVTRTYLELDMAEKGH